MKLKLLHIALIGILFLVSSCETDNLDLDPTTSISYNGVTQNIATAGYKDLKAKTVYGSEATHRNYDFYATDGSFLINNAGTFLDVKGKFMAFAELNSPSTSDFKMGTYQFIDDSNDGSLSREQLKAKYDNKYFFTYSYIIYTALSNSLLNSNDLIDVSSGTITVSGDKPNYTITYDVVLENGKTLKGSYKGNFKSL